ncbi:unnamed protein product [Miscanthus lutarioriparius]|uniref:Legume lectin domain-containing protein n=1 Tax=Miscanthus lutarioriparius TaxID=422564 RepID=A0A811S2P4_9POAL|nr:unnamed protein product [Miscanthus lutarioriparius]
MANKKQGGNSLLLLLRLISLSSYYLLCRVPHATSLSFSYNFSNPGVLTSADLTYDANASTLSATLRFDHLPELGLYNVSATVDFKEAGLPQQAAVGFSGATGDFVERHQILSWSFESTLVSVAVVNTTGKCLSLLVALLFLLFFPLFIRLEMRCSIYNMNLM